MALIKEFEHIRIPNEYVIMAAAAVLGEEGVSLRHYDNPIEALSDSDYLSSIRKALTDPKIRRKVIQLAGSDDFAVMAEPFRDTIRDYIQQMEG